MARLEEQASRAVNNCPVILSALCQLSFMVDAIQEDEKVPNPNPNPSVMVPSRHSPRWSLFYGTARIAGQQSHVSPILEGPGSTPERRVVGQPRALSASLHVVPKFLNRTNPNPNTTTLTFTLTTTYLQ